MSIVTPPALHSLASYSYTARTLRRFLQSVAGDAEGVLGAGDLAVGPTGPASMSLSVAAGRALVAGDTVARQGVYLIENDASMTVGPLGAAHASLPRIDLVVIEDLDSSSDGGSAASDLQRVRIIQGTPAGTPAVPATPPNAIALARVAVAASATSINSAAITDVRARARVGDPGLDRIYAVSIGQNAALTADGADKSFTQALGSLVINPADLIASSGSLQWRYRLRFQLVATNGATAISFHMRAYKHGVDWQDIAGGTSPTHGVAIPLTPGFYGVDSGWVSGVLSPTVEEAWIPGYRVDFLTAGPTLSIAAGMLEVRRAA